MTHEKINYSIRGYRYAPESFLGFRLYPGGTKEEIPLSEEQRRELGTIYLTKGRGAAFGYLKRVEREWARKCQLYMTYGFMLEESPRTYLFCEQLRCREDAPLGQRLQVYREFRDHLRQQGCKVRTCVECRLDGQCRPVEIQEHYLTANLSRPVIVWLKAS